MVSRRLELGVHGRDFSAIIYLVPAGLASMRRKMRLARARVGAALGAGWSSRGDLISDIALVAKHVAVAALDALRTPNNPRDGKLSDRAELSSAPWVAASSFTCLLLGLDLAEAALANDVPAGNCVSLIARRGMRKWLTALRADVEAKGLLAWGLGVTHREILRYRGEIGAW